MYNIKIVSLFQQKLAPERVSTIIRPVISGLMVMSMPENSVRSLFTR